MTFHCESFEQVFSDICATGYNSGFIVVPEFSLLYLDGIERTKVADVAWLVAHNHNVDDYGFPKFRVVAAFEVEGFNVSFKTIRSHLRIYRKIKARYGPVPCYVPLYSKAVHRKDYGDDEDLVEDCIEDRKSLVRYENLVTICDAGTRDWLKAAVKIAKELRDSYLQPAQIRRR